MYINTPFKIYYDTLEYDFNQKLHEIFGVDNITKIHEFKSYDRLKRENDQSTIWHERFYNNFHRIFEPLYKNLIIDIKTSFGYDKIIYQKIPSFRVQLGNGNVAVGEWHKDKTYNHGTTEVNFWLPFITTTDNNTIWIESKEDIQDYRPYNVNYGEILIFNGANLNHGNVSNNTNVTRTSIDFRLVDPAKFIPNDKGSINKNVKFDLGGYFDII